jgi:SOS-response transcriptional repressor LexA
MSERADAADTPRSSGPASPSPTRVTYVPVIGRIAADGPILAETPDDAVFALPRDMVGGGTLFALQATGDSMIGADIADGDWLVVRQQPTASNGDIVAAMVDGEPTVKVFQHDRGRTWLRPRNPAYPPIAGDDATILGRVVAVLHPLRARQPEPPRLASHLAGDGGAHGYPPGDELDNPPILTEPAAAPAPAVVAPTLTAAQTSVVNRLAILLREHPDLGQPTTPDDPTAPDGIAVPGDITARDGIAGPGDITAPDGITGPGDITASADAADPTSRTEPDPATAPDPDEPAVVDFLQRVLSGLRRL